MGKVLLECEQSMVVAFPAMKLPPGTPILWVNPKKIAPIILSGFPDPVRPTRFGFQLAESVVIFFNKNANPPDEIPEYLLNNYKRENTIIIQVDVPPGKFVTEMIRVFRCKESGLDQRDIDGLWGEINVR